MKPPGRQSVVFGENISLFLLFLGDSKDYTTDRVAASPVWLEPKVQCGGNEGCEKE